MLQKGLSEYRIKAIIQKELDNNPDLKYYINNPYIDELIVLLIDGISKAIFENNRAIAKDMESKKRRGY